MADSVWKRRRRRREWKRFNDRSEYIAWQLLLVVLAWSVSTSAGDGKIAQTFDRIFDHVEGIQCRLLQVDTLYETPDGSLRTVEEVFCVTILSSGRESDHIFAIELPNEFVENHSTGIRQGQLVVSIQGAISSIEKREILLASTSTVTIVQSRADNHAFTDQRVLDSTTNGASSPSSTNATRTVTVIRVSSVDSAMSRSAMEIGNILFGEDRINFVSQYAACSFGSLRFTRSKYGVLDVFLNQTLEEMSRDSSFMVYRALEIVRDQFNLESVTELSDHVMMCLPPGTGDWAANAGVNYWRSHFNDQWCTSLSATMHELGHKYVPPDGRCGSYLMCCPPLASVLRCCCVQSRPASFERTGILRGQHWLQYVGGNFALWPYDAFLLKLTYLCSFTAVAAGYKNIGMYRAV
jgi:hypothetical protein